MSKKFARRTLKDKKRHKFGAACFFRPSFFQKGHNEVFPNIFFLKPILLLI